MKRLVPSAVASALAGALAIFGCAPDPGPWVRPRRAESSPDQVKALAPPEMRVEYGGCSTVLLSDANELQCVYEPGATLRLWVTHEKSARPEFGVEGDGAWSMGEPYVLAEELGQGYRIELEGEGLRAVTVTLPDRPEWRLVLRSKGGLSEEEAGALERSRKRRIELERQIYREKLELLPEARAIMYQRIDEGLLWSAITYGAAISYHLTWKVGRPKLAQELLEDIRTRIEHRLPDFDRSFSFGSAELSVYLGHALERRGQLVAAAHEYRRGARILRRVDDVMAQLDVLPSYALVLANLGYFEAAAYWGAQARDNATKHARPLQLSFNLAAVAEVSLLLRDAHQIHDDPAPRYEEIQKIYGPGGALPNEKVPFDILLARAEFELGNGHPKQALSHLEPFRKQRLPPHHRAKVEELWLRGLLDSGASDQALRAALSRIQDANTHSIAPELRWRAAALEGRLLEELEQPNKALEAYQRAEGQLDRLLPLAALGLPGDFAAARHSRSTDRLISLFAQQGRVDDAICTIRRSRARVGQMALLHRHADVVSREDLSATIESYNLARQDYDQLVEDSSELDAAAHEAALTSAAQRHKELERHTFEILSSQVAYRSNPDCRELEPRRPGELLLLLYSEGDDLHVFVEDDVGSTMFPSLLGYFEHQTSDDWRSDLLLHPMTERIAKARSIRVLSSRKANQIPVHALPWSQDVRETERKPLIQSKPVVYGLDLPLAPSSEDGARTRRALVMADDHADGAQAESTAISSSLRSLGWVVDELSAREVEPRSLREAFGSARHFHYAGHAYFDEGFGRQRALVAEGQEPHAHLRRWPPYAGGAARQPSYIPLGNHGSRLTVPDILMMDHVPETVVLMGCTTGIVDERMAWGGFSLATAFLGAGSRVVVASTRPIDGHEAESLSRALYTALESSDEIDPGRWMTDALNLIDARGGVMPSVEDYRVYVP